MSEKGMYGLAVRWSLEGTGPETAEALREYVRSTSLQRFTGMAGMRFKTWRMVEGAWFEGTYVWASAEERDAFAEADRARTAESPVTGIIGAEPVVYQAVEVVGVAEGGAGFASGPGPGGPGGP